MDAAPPLATGPLSGFKILEIAGVGPTQFAGMLLADLGAEVVRLDRLHAAEIGIPIPPRYNLMNRGRASIAVDLKSDEGIEVVLQLCESADALFEGFRPGVMERLGLAPDICMDRNPRLVYGRMTGWGQSGPLAQTAGHDPNYLAVAGVLGALEGPDGGPATPLNLIGDGGGALYLVVGILAGLLETSRSGRGQVIDAAIIDSSASLMTLYYGLLAAGLWKDQRGANLFDGAAPFLRSYRTLDGEYIVVAALEDRFFAELLGELGLTEEWAQGRMDPARWPALSARLEEAIGSKTRAEWTDLTSNTDACVSPVLSLSEALAHPHNQARGTFEEFDGIPQPSVAPRFDRTPGRIARGPAAPGENTREVLTNWGFENDTLEDLEARGIIAGFVAPPGARKD